MLQEAVTEFSRATGFPLAFGGYESNGVTTVTALSGTEGHSLQGLRVANWRGLGGKAMIEHRPRFTRDYMSSQTISHDYDLEIGAERIVMLVAVPVVVDGVTRAVLYGGTRGETAPDATFMQAAAGVSEELARWLRADDLTRAASLARGSVSAAAGAEAATAPTAAAMTAAATAAPTAFVSAPTHHRQSHSTTATAPASAVPAVPAVPAALPGTVIEELRSSHAEIRRIAAATTDPVAREALGALERRLAGIGRAEPPATEVRLTARELDVLSEASRGGTNQHIAAALGIAESTVKGYLKTAMHKLETPTRHAAVTAARGFGLIP
ncbi:response regulator transcription factor [Leucobacter albus]|uniref:Response regulator transcription factor n=1 Tax=Leucobacter albus TaxID=272210 RepID=A0ABW3TQU2_9MICO